MKYVVFNTTLLTNKGEKLTSKEVKTRSDLISPRSWEALDTFEDLEEAQRYILDNAKAPEDIKLKAGEARAYDIYEIGTEDEDGEYLGSFDIIGIGEDWQR